MTIHHIVKTVDKDGSCIYCSKPFKKEEWQSHFTPGTHYKGILCECGKLNYLEVFFIGTGHDTWSGLESKVVHEKGFKIAEKNIKVMK